MTFSRIALAALLLSSTFLPATADARSGGGHGARGGFSSGGHHGGSAPRMMHRPTHAGMAHGTSHGFRPMHVRPAAQWHARGHAHRHAGIMPSRAFHRPHSTHAWVGRHSLGYHHRPHHRFAASTTVRHRHDFQRFRHRTTAYGPTYGYGSALAYGYADDYGSDYGASYYADSGYYADSNYQPGFLAWLASEGDSLSSADAYASAPVQLDYPMYSYRPQCSCY